jgi:hypothetical protein
VSKTFGFEFGLNFEQGPGVFESNGSFTGGFDLDLEGFESIYFDSNWFDEGLSNISVFYLGFLL